MDFRHLCSKIDVDSIRARFPPLPALPQIRLPKSLSKLRSRRIFRSSGEDIRKSSLQQQTQQPIAPNLLTPPIEPAEFIDHTPTRISTISSLMQQQQQQKQQRSAASRHTASNRTSQYRSSTYRSAGSIDDDFPLPNTLHSALYADSPRQTPPIKQREVSLNNHASSSAASISMTLGEKLQKGYKDISDFRLKHILTKKTLVRRDNIMVDYYVQRYEEDRIAEERIEMQREQEMVENFNINFDTTFPDTDDSLSLTDSETPKERVLQTSKKREPRTTTRMSRSSAIEPSDDESGMEDTPPKRIYTKSTSAKFNQQNDISKCDSRSQEPPSSSLWAIKQKQQVRKPGRNQTTAALESTVYKEHMRRASSNASLDAKSAVEKHNTHSRSKFTSQQSLDESTVENGPMSALKENLKRFKSNMSLKRQAPMTGKDTAHVDGSKNSTERQAGQRAKALLVTRLRCLRSRNATTVGAEATDGSEASAQKSETLESSPLRNVIASKLQIWKKSLMKSKPAIESTTPTSAADDDTSVEKQHTRSLITKLKYIRSRKNTNSSDEPDAEDGYKADTVRDTRKNNNYTIGRRQEQKYEDTHNRTMKRVNEGIRKLPLVQKTEEDNDMDRSSLEIEDVTGALSPPRRSRRSIQQDVVHNDETEDIEEITSNDPREETSYLNRKQLHAIWTTKPILTDSTESDETNTVYPRVLLHQNNSDDYESTLIIAVTNAPPNKIKSRITEILEEPVITRVSGSQALSLPPNTKNVEDFTDLALETSTKITATRSGDCSSTPLTYSKHTRELSVDSNLETDSRSPESIVRKNDFFISKEAARHASSVVGLNSIQEYDEPWRAQPSTHTKVLYKNRSVDIFEENIKRGGVHAAFEDFDDELRNEPVLKIGVQAHSEDESFNKDSSEDAYGIGDDNTSRVTRIHVDDSPNEASQRNFILKRSASEESQNGEIGNSRESLDANYDENEEYTDNDDDIDDVDDRPPSVAPSPPPSFSPPPPPLPQRQSSMRFGESQQLPEMDQVMPPLPITTPPALPTRPPPQIPARTESMAHIAKPLVKTASLRLAYAEQVRVADVGKVNKLISRFEQSEPPGSTATKPRILRCAIMGESWDNYYGYEEKYANESVEYESEHSENELEINANKIEATKTVPILKPTLTTQESSETVQRVIKQKRIAPQPEPLAVVTEVTNQLPTDKALDAQNNTTEKTVEHNKKFVSNRKSCLELNTEQHLNIPKLTLTTADFHNQNMPASQAGSVYGSPLEYPSSLIGSTQNTPVPSRKQQQETNITLRRGRSLVRDDDQYYSFDSDEENSYYSLSSAGSNRYVVEI